MRKRPHIVLNNLDDTVHFLNRLNRFLRRLGYLGRAEVWATPDNVINKRINGNRRFILRLPDRFGLEQDVRMLADRFQESRIQNIGMNNRSVYPAFDPKRTPPRNIRAK